MKFNLHSFKVKILSASFLSAAFLVTVGFAVQGHVRANAYQNTLNNTYQHAFSELTTAMYEVDTALQKLSYATSTTLVSTLCTELFGRTMAAQMALGELPYGNVELEQTAAFVAKAGDYAEALSKSAAAKGSCSAEERQNLRALATASASLSQMLQDLQSDIHRGTITLEDLRQAEERLSASTEDGKHILAGSAYQNMESQFPEVPSLVYDGPFSQHLSNRSPKQLEGKELYSQGQALTAAAAFLDVKPEILSLTASVEGSLPAWGFSAVIDGGEVYLEVSRKGGLVVQMISSRPTGEAKVDPKVAVESAMAFLKVRGYDGLQPSYYINQGNVLTINLASVQEGVLCYPDLIKVSVALDTGRVAGFEAKGYLMNHTARTLPQPAVTADEARAVISPDLEILSTALTLIPTDGEYEVLCHEFKCQTLDGKHYLVYVNAQSGDEERILILLEDETGTLVI